MSESIERVEHGSLAGVDEVPKDLKIGVEHPPLHLGLNRDLRLSYFIGTDWLTDEKVDPSKDLALIVRPKFENIDYMTLFSEALDIEDEFAGAYFSECFGIDFDKPPIEANGMDSILTPLIIAIFVAEVKRLLARGLKKGYVEREENLNCRMKGKIILPRQIQQNDILGMRHRMFCRYNEFSCDIKENRILKKALLCSKNYLISHLSSNGEINRQVDIILLSFSEVSDDIEISEVRSLKENKIYKGYSNAVKMAKHILRHFDYSLSSSCSNKHSVPVFWIDMPRLFEMHTLSVLKKAFGNQIRFQQKGYRGRQIPDFIKVDEKLVLDAKYKPYDEEAISIDDIREVSGNARDLKLRKQMMIDDGDRTELNCIIAYCDPYANYPDLSQSLMDCPQLEKVEGYSCIYKLAIPVPTLNEPIVE